MSLRRKTVNGSWCLAAAVVFSCSVFPDEATLPSAAAGAAVGGTMVLPAGGAGGDGVDPTPLGGAGAAEGGALSVAGVGASSGAPPLGMAGAAAGGAGGAGGAPACASPQQMVIPVTADTWIESAKPGTGHGNDKVLSVVGGGQARRALLEATLPAAIAGAALLKATLVLHLQANAEGLAQRQLRLHQLAHPVIEGRADWTQWNNGVDGGWMTLGGDFGAAVAQAAVPAATSEATLNFDVTAVVRSTFSTMPVPLSLILLETSAPPPAPAELAFTSREGDASFTPKLIVEYCEP